MRHLLSQPWLVWVVLFAMLCTMVSVPPKGWKAITVAACWFVVLVLLVLRFI